MRAREEDSGGEFFKKLLPNFERGMSFGNKYKEINELFLYLSNDLKIDLWALDTLWWKLLNETPCEGEKPNDVSEQTQRFGLEKHHVLVLWTNSEVN